MQEKQVHLLKQVNELQEELTKLKNQVRDIRQQFNSFADLLDMDVDYIFSFQRQEPEIGENSAARVRNFFYIIAFILLFTSVLTGFLIYFCRV